MYVKIILHAWSTPVKNNCHFQGSPWHGRSCQLRVLKQSLIRRAWCVLAAFPEGLLLSLVLPQPQFDEFVGSPSRLCILTTAERVYAHSPLFFEILLWGKFCRDILTPFFLAKITQVQGLIWSCKNNLNWFFLWFYATFNIAQMCKYLSVQFCWVSFSTRSATFYNFNCTLVITWQLCVS